VAGLLDAADALRDEERSDVLVNLVLVEAARRFARSGDIDGALSIKDRMQSFWGGWDAADIFAEIVRCLVAAGHLDEARRVLADAAAEALAAVVVEGKGDSALESLSRAIREAGCSDLLPGLAAALPPERRGVVHAWIAREMDARGDTAGADALALGVADHHLRSYALLDLVDRAAARAETARVRRLAPALVEAGFAHRAAAALACAGDERSALKLVDRIEPGWSRAEALAQIALIRARRGDHRDFEALTARAVDDLVTEEGARYWFQIGDALADAALEALGVAGALGWVQGVPEPDPRHLVVEALCRRLTATGRHDAARTLAEAQSDPELRDDLLADLRTAEADRRARGAVARAVEAAAAGRTDVALASIRVLARPFERAFALLDVARALAAGGDAGGAARALREATEALLRSPREDTTLGAARAVGAAFRDVLARGDAEVVAGDLIHHSVGLSDAFARALLLILADEMLER
jgi:hypothetical protein